MTEVESVELEDPGEGGRANWCSWQLPQEFWRAGPESPAWGLAVLLCQAAWLICSTGFEGKDSDADSWRSVSALGFIEETSRPALLPRLGYMSLPCTLCRFLTWLLHF